GGRAGGSAARSRGPWRDGQLLADCGRLRAERLQKEDTDQGSKTKAFHIASFKRVKKVFKNRPRQVSGIARSEYFSVAKGRKREKDILFCMPVHKTPLPSRKNKRWFRR